jgi:hypothetical protein
LTPGFFFFTDANELIVFSLESDFKR